MQIYFKGTTNKDYTAVNTADFILKNGTKITVDRNQTAVDDNEDGTFTMVWYDCYLWSINDCNLFYEGAKIEDTHEFKSLIKGADLKINLDEDTDEDYKVTILAWSVRE